jgi:hypothetical protein
MGKPVREDLFELCVSLGLIWLPLLYHYAFVSTSGDLGSQTGAALQFMDEDCRMPFGLASKNDFSISFSRQASAKSLFCAEVAGDELLFGNKGFPTLDRCRKIRLSTDRSSGNDGESS